MRVSVSGLSCVDEDELDLISTSFNYLIILLNLQKDGFDIKGIQYDQPLENSCGSYDEDFTRELVTVIFGPDSSCSWIDSSDKEIILPYIQDEKEYIYILRLQIPCEHTLKKILSIIYGEYPGQIVYVGLSFNNGVLMYIVDLDSDQFIEEILDTFLYIKKFIN